MAGEGGNLGSFYTRTVHICQGWVSFFVLWLLDFTILSPDLGLQCGHHHFESFSDFICSLAIHSSAPSECVNASRELALLSEGTT